jgi:hypothetical protein
MTDSIVAKYPMEISISGPPSRQLTRDGKQEVSHAFFKAWGMEDGLPNTLVNGEPIGKPECTPEVQEAARLGLLVAK